MKLIKYPNAALNLSADPWQFDSADDCVNAAQVEHSMISLMKTSNGIGLAAPQVGISQRMFVMRTQDGREFGVFNPQLIYVSASTHIDKEGCLSFPDLWLLVERSTDLTAQYLDNTGTERIITLTGIDARCFLHELDHLAGICFTNNLSQLKLAMAIKKQRKQNGRTKR